MITIDQVTNFLIENPGSLFQLAESVADCNPQYARLIGQTFEYLATFYGEPQEDGEPDCDDGEPDCDDGDALASAGWGTDEDYGGDCDRI